ncbi:LytR/AlgR family response regulator transcription factor [Spirosoma gilvum]
MITFSGQTPLILIIEDEVILSLDLCLQLETQGYAIAGTAATGRQALALYQQQQVDLIICDINLRGDWTGIETVRHLAALKPVPVIYLSAISDRSVLEQAKTTQPAAYLVKPVTGDNLRVAIEIALSNFAYSAVSDKAKLSPEISPTAFTGRDGETILQIGEHIFIKQNHQFIRLRQKDVLYIEAEDKYTTVVTPTRKFVLRLSLAILLQRLGDMPLVRVHRSYAINMDNVESFNDYEIHISGQTIPLGRVYKEEFLKNFSTR